MRARGTLTYDVAPDVACAYLSDPVHRPEWQSSLRRVELRDTGEPHVGQRWEDHTAVGLVAQMTTTDLEPGVRWSESGTWRNVTADLTLTFSPHGTGCRVDVELGIRVSGVLAVVGPVATLGGLPAVKADLAKAGRILSEREHR
ncbi:SRPBCC family protein [Nocardioides marmoraquaticus]